MFLQDFSFNIYTLLYLFSIYLVLASLGLGCCMWAVSCGREWGLLSSCSAQASHCSGFSSCRARALDTRASIVVVHGLSCSVACEIFPGQGLNLCLLLWQVDSQSLARQRSPHLISFCTLYNELGLSFLFY